MGFLGVSSFSRSRSFVFPLALLSSSVLCWHQTLASAVPEVFSNYSIVQVPLCCCCKLILEKPVHTRQENFFSDKALKTNINKVPSPALSTPPKHIKLYNRDHQETIHFHQNSHKIHHGRWREVSRSLCGLTSAKTEG